MRLRHLGDIDDNKVRAMILQLRGSATGASPADWTRERLMQVLRWYALDTEPRVLAEVDRLLQIVSTTEPGAERNRLLNIAEALPATGPGSPGYGMQTPAEILASGQQSNSTSITPTPMPTETELPATDTPDVPWLLLAAGAGAVWWWFARRPA